MRIATWNVNSVNARVETVVAWLREHSPDVACFQEIKCEEHKFPALAFEELGYNTAVWGQKSYNGVAILSKFPIGDVRRGLPDPGEEEQSRYIEAVIEAPRPVRVASIYLPNGNPVDSEKFPYKLAWMERLRRHAVDLLRLEESLVLCGDYNVIPDPEDARNPAQWVRDALFQPESRAAWRAFKGIGLSEAHELAGEPPGTFTFWDYQAGAWRRNDGIRIDHHFLSPQAVDRFLGMETHRDARDMEKPSDHVPVVIELTD
ncbi:MAG: exodeoxyribonuclease III [Caulobacteraceae bacterium]|nr:exodeoxyribonuclease III [Caulobacteraceae bacterium]